MTLRLISIKQFPGVATVFGLTCAHLEGRPAAVQSLSDGTWLLFVFPFPMKHGKEASPLSGQVEFRKPCLASLDVFMRLCVWVRASIVHVGIVRRRTLSKDRASRSECH